MRTVFGLLYDVPSTTDITTLDEDLSAATGASPPPTDIRPDMGLAPTGRSIFILY